MNAPVIVFVYNRLQHTQQLFASLAAARGASDTDVIIYSDAARNATDETLVANVRKYIMSVSGFKSVSIIEQKHNIGLAANIINGLSKVFEQYEQAIVLEDDLIVSVGFLEYMNAALRFYAERNVFAISGYTPRVNIPASYKHSTYFVHRNCSWGWATWRSKWQATDWNVTHFDTFVRNSTQRAQFDQAGSDLSAMLLRWRIGEINSWSIRFCFAAFEHGEPTVYPVRSLISNAGADGSGSNVAATSKYNTTITDFINTTTFAPNANIIDASIVQSFRQTYNCSLFRRIINAIKRWHYILSPDKK